MTVIFGFGWPFEELLIIRVLMLSVEACAEAKVGKLDVPFRIKKDVVWFDVPMRDPTDQLS